MAALRRGAWCVVRGAWCVVRVVSAARYAPRAVNKRVGLRVGVQISTCEATTKKCWCSMQEQAFGLSADDTTPPHHAESARPSAVQAPLAPPTCYVRRSLAPAYQQLPRVARAQPSTRACSGFCASTHATAACSILGHTQRYSDDATKMHEHVKKLGRHLNFGYAHGILALAILQRTACARTTAWPTEFPLIACSDAELTLVCMCVAFKLANDNRLRVSNITATPVRWMQIEAHVLLALPVSATQFAQTAMDEHAFRKRLQCDPENACRAWSVPSSLFSHI